MIFIKRVRKVRSEWKVETLKDYTKIVVETDEKDPVIIATITTEEVKVVDGYRVRLTPLYD